MTRMNAADELPVNLTDFSDSELIELRNWDQEEEVIFSRSRSSEFPFCSGSTVNFEVCMMPGPFSHLYCSGTGLENG